MRMRVCAGMMCEGGYVYARYSTGGEKTTFSSQFPLSVLGLRARTQISRLAWQTLPPPSAGPSHALQKFLDYGPYLAQWKCSIIAVTMLFFFLRE